jgi:hypothetical protein
MILFIDHLHVPSAFSPILTPYLSINIAQTLFGHDILAGGGFESRIRYFRNKFYTGFLEIIEYFLYMHLSVHEIKELSSRWSLR